jgi:hypothetical protein
LQQIILDLASRDDGKLTAGEFHILLNSAVLIIITAMLVLAVVVGANLAQHAK